MWDFLLSFTSLSTLGAAFVKWVIHQTEKPRISGSHRSGSGLHRLSLRMGWCAILFLRLHGAWPLRFQASTGQFQHHVCHSHQDEHRDWEEEWLEVSRCLYIIHSLRAGNDNRSLGSCRDHLFCWIVKVLVWDRKVSKLAVVPWASWSRAWSHTEKKLNRQIWKEVCSRVCSSPLGWWLVGQAWRALRSPHLRLLQPQVQAKQWAPKRSQPCASVKRFDCFPHKLLLVHRSWKYFFKVSHRFGTLWLLVVVDLERVLIHGLDAQR